MDKADHHKHLKEIKCRLGADEFERLSKKICELILKTLPYASVLGEYVSEPSIRLDDLAALILRQIAHDDESHPLAGLSLDEQLQAIMSYFASSSGRPLGGVEVNIDANACNVKSTKQKLHQYPVLSDYLCNFDFGERYLN